MYQLVKAEQGQFVYKNGSGKVRIQVFLDAKVFRVQMVTHESEASGKTAIAWQHVKCPLFYFIDTARSVPEEKQSFLSEFYEEEDAFLDLAGRWERLLMLLLTLERCRRDNPDYLKEVCALFAIELENPQAEETCIRYLMEELSKYEEFQNIAKA